MTERPLARDPELIDLFAEVLGHFFDARRFGERVLGLLIDIERGRSGALFKVAGDKLALIVGRGIDQAGLERVEKLWVSCSASLAAGETFYTPDVQADPQLRDASDSAGPVACALIPVVRERTLLGLLYLDSMAADFGGRGDLDTFRKFAEIVTPAVVRAIEDDGASGTWERFLETNSLEEIERAKLILLLRRHSWNITHVSRLMGITRATLYQRLQRHGIEREKPQRLSLRRGPSTA